MPECPPNSFKYREQQKTEAPERKFDKVVSGTTRTRKKSDKRKLFDIFKQEDRESVKEHVLFEIMLPAAKKIFLDSVEAFVYPSGNPNRNPNRRIGDRVSYDGYSRERRETSYRKRSAFDFDDIVFESRGDAEIVLDKMDEAIYEYDFVTVDDFYDFAGITNKNYMARSYGWYSLRDAKVIRLRSDEGYIIDFPKAVPRKG